MKLQQNGKRKLLSDIWKIIDQGVYLAGVAQEFGFIGESTISDIQRDRKNLEKFSVECADPSSLKKRCIVRRE